MRDWTFDLIQMDELYAKVKDADVARWLWLAIDLPQTDHHVFNHVEGWRGYYHWIRPHQTLREPIRGEPRGQRARTPAVALGLTDHIWTRLARSDPPAWHKWCEPANTITH